MKLQNATENLPKLDKPQDRGAFKSNSVDCPPGGQPYRKQRFCRSRKLVFTEEIILEEVWDIRCGARR